MKGFQSRRDFLFESCGGLSGLAGGLVVLGGARLLRIREVTSVVDTVAARVRRR